MGQIVDVEIAGVEDEGVALVGQTLVGRRQAVGVATAGGDERLTTQTKAEIVPAEESCPQQNLLGFSSCFDSSSRLGRLVRNLLLAKLLLFD